jgi:PEP-CTERM motif
MLNLTRIHSLFAFLVLGVMLPTPSALASVIPVGPAVFPTGSTLLTFTGLPDGTEVNGLTAGGLLFNYSLGNGNVVIDGGPGVTNNINPPNIVSTGNNTGILTVLLPGPTGLFGYGFALLNQSSVANATTITLFSGMTNVGSLSYAGVPDIVFAGGFAGIQSTIPFDRVQVTFNSTAAPAFAIDNVRAGAVIPEPSSMLLVLGGALGVFWRKNRFHRSS